MHKTLQCHTSVQIVFVYFSYYNIVFYNGIDSILCFLLFFSFVLAQKCATFGCDDTHTHIGFILHLLHSFLSSALIIYFIFKLFIFFFNIHAINDSVFVSVDLKLASLTNSNNNNFFFHWIKKQNEILNCWITACSIIYAFQNDNVA